MNLEEFDYEQLYELATNSDTSSELLDKIAQIVGHDQPSLLLEIAENPNTTSATLEFIADTYSGFDLSEVMLAVARNVKVNSITLNSLVLGNESMDEIEELKEIVCMSEVASAEILFFLSHDENDDISEMARENPNWIELNAQSLAQFAESEHEEIRFFVALNDHTPIETLRILANDYDYIRQACAENPNCDAELMTQLSSS
jgi:hypothetical protein